MGENSLGRMIRRFREQKGWKQAELAGRIGGKTSQKQVSMWETGKAQPRRKRLERIAELLDTPVEVFLEAAGIATEKTYVEVIDPELARQLFREARNHLAQHGTVSQIEAAFIRAGISPAAFPDWLEELRKELKKEE